VSGLVRVPVAWQEGWEGGGNGSVLFWLYGRRAV